METDKFQQAWKAHTSRMRVTVDADLLLTSLKRQRQQLGEPPTFLGNVFGTVVFLLFLGAWISVGVQTSAPWTWYLMVAAFIWMKGFDLLSRARRKRITSDPGQPLLSSVQESLAVVEHQIWVFRNWVWGFFLPVTIPLLAYPAQLLWLKRINPHAGIAGFLFTAAIYCGLHYAIRWYVRTQLEPRRQELLRLLASLRNETPSEVNGGYPMLMGSMRHKLSRRQKVAVSLFIAADLLMACGLFLLGYEPAWSPPWFAALALTVVAGAGLAFLGYILWRTLHPLERSPFAAVRWQESQPEVRVGTEWFKLVSLDNIPATEIVAFSQWSYGDKWQKRFEEDLVAILTRMGHPPGDTVTLVVQSLTSSETRTLEGIPMTKANRQAIKDAAMAREHKNGTGASEDPGSKPAGL